MMWIIFGIVFVVLLVSATQNKEDNSAAIDEKTEDDAKIEYWEMKWKQFQEERGEL